MFEFFAVVLILFGSAIFLLAFKPGYQKIGPIIVGEEYKRGRVRYIFPKS